MKANVSCALLAIAVPLLCPAIASAQQTPGAVYVQAGLAVPWQSGATGTSPVTYVTAPGGMSVGWLAAAGVWVAPRAHVHAELSTTGWMRATEPSRYFTTYEEARRDRFLTMGVSVALPVARSLSIEAMGGVVLTFNESTSQAVSTDPTAPRPPTPVVVHDLDTGVGPALGSDVRIGGGRITVVPSFRLMRTAIGAGRYDDTSPSSVDIESIYPGGYPSWTLRSAVAVRVQF